MSVRTAGVRPHRHDSCDGSRRTRHDSDLTGVALVPTSGLAVVAVENKLAWTVVAEDELAIAGERRLGADPVVSGLRMRAMLVWWSRGWLRRRGR